MSIFVANFHKMKNTNLYKKVFCFCSDFDYAQDDTDEKVRGEAEWDLGGASLRMTRDRVAKNLRVLLSEKFLCSFNALFLKADQLSCQRQSLLGAVGIFVITN